MANVSSYEEDFTMSTPVFEKDLTGLLDGGTERLAGSLVCQDSRQGLPELLTAVQAPPPLGFYSHIGVPLPGFLMPHQAPVYSPASLAVALTDVTPTMISSFVKIGSARHTRSDRERVGLIRGAFDKLTPYLWICRAASGSVA
jgi:hypothetical protein